MLFRSHTASTAAAIAVASELLTAERLGASQPTANNKELTAKAAAITLEICKEMHFDLKPQNLKISVAASNNQAVARTIFHPFSRQHEIQLGKNLQTNLKNLEARTPYTQDEYLRAILGHEIVHAKEHHQFFHIFAPAFVTLSLSKTFQKLPLFNGRPGYKTAMIIGLGILNFTLVERFMSRQIEQREIGRASCRERV